MRVTLEVLSGPEAGRSMTIPSGTELSVGRKAPTQFVIEADPTLSRLHFCLIHETNGCRLRDLGSTAGTLLNHRLVTDALVKDGDTIEAGTTRFLVRIDIKAMAEAPPQARPEHVPIDVYRDGPVTEQIPAFDEESPLGRTLKAIRSRKEPLFAILDAARDPLVLVRLNACKEQNQSLYEGPKGDRLAAAAPYLVSLPPNSAFLETLVGDGWAKSWGIYLTSQAPFSEVRKHLRRFLTVETEEGKKLLFRFYDPRVLRGFLPTCKPEEWNQFFGPICHFRMESASGESLLEFGIEGQRLVQAELSLADLDPQA